VSANEPIQNAQPNDSQTTVGRTVDGLLNLVPAPVAETVRLAAVPHWFDQALLVRLSRGDLEVEPAMPYLRRFRFVQEDAFGRFRYHEEVRDYLLAWWRQERPQQFRRANQTALSYFNALAERAPFVERPTYEYEVLYHLLLVDEARGLDYLLVRFEEAFGRYQLGSAERLVAQATQHDDHLTAGGQQWTRYFLARLDQAYQRPGAETTFQDLAGQAPEPALRALATWNLGQIRVDQRRWSQATRLYRASLNLLQGDHERRYRARVMVAMGEAYRNLADHNGGFQPEEQKPSSALSRFLNTLQHLPFRLYERLVHRLNFLPNWYFGTSFQDWIIAYLFMAARRWYRRAEKEFSQVDDPTGLTEARLLLAELDHRVGRWSRAKGRYQRLLTQEEIKGSRYRTARVRLGQGRAFLAEKAPLQAEITLSEALETFRQVNDQGSIGLTTALLGRTYTALHQFDQAISTYTESIRAFEAVGDQLARTRTVSALESLPRSAVMTAEQKQQIDSVTSGVIERHYLMRFPERLLGWFRGLAIFGALPLTYVGTLIITFLLAIPIQIIEGEFALAQAGIDAQTTITDALLLALGIFIPLALALWSFRFFYSFIGTIVVRLLGRRLVPIEREQPSYFVTTPNGLTRHDLNQDASQTVAWTDIASAASVDYSLWRQPMHLISRTILGAGSGEALVAEAITSGYEALKGDIARHLPADRPLRSLDFTIFEPRWVLVTVVIALVFALHLFFYDHFKATMEVTPSGETVILPLSTLLIPFSQMTTLLFPAIVFWRLLGHQIAVRRRFKPHRVKPVIPSWVLGASALFCTLILVLWTILRLGP